jgi:hypothetical protein
MRDAAPCWLVLVLAAAACGRCRLLAWLVAGCCFFIEIRLLLVAV